MSTQKPALWLDENYSEKAIAIFGNTKPLKDQIKNELGGKFNGNLRHGAGWVMVKKTLEKARLFVQMYLPLAESSQSPVNAVNLPAATTEINIGPRIAAGIASETIPQVSGYEKIIFELEQKIRNDVLFLEKIRKDLLIMKNDRMPLNNVLPLPGIASGIASGMNQIDEHQMTENDERPISLKHPSK